MSSDRAIVLSNNVLVKPDSLEGCRHMSSSGTIMEQENVIGPISVCMQVSYANIKCHDKHEAECGMPYSTRDVTWMVNNSALRQVGICTLTSVPQAPSLVHSFSRRLKSH